MTDGHFLCPINKLSKEMRNSNGKSNVQTASVLQEKDNRQEYA
jgi:hypothetical protein